MTPGLLFYSLSEGSLGRSNRSNSLSLRFFCDRDLLNFSGWQQRPSVLVLGHRRFKPKFLKMKSIYLTVIVLLTSTVLTAQIREVPVLGNPILQKMNADKKADIGFPNDLDQIQKRGDCPLENPDIVYLFPADTFLIELDISNKQAYEVIDSAASIGTIQADSNFIIVRAGNVNGAVRANLTLLKTVDGRDSIEIDYPFILKRPNSSVVMATEILAPEETVSVCAEPIASLPGEINCNEIFHCAEDYGGRDLQLYFFESGNSDENCYRYHATRFPGTDTICVVLCDEFTVCDTFKQPFVIVGDTLSLPFYEDFSDSEVFPNKERWLEDLTFINQTMTYEPPSVGVATFDGLDASGVPYGEGFGTADRLTSKQINLGKENVNSGLVFSFYYQMKGRGFLPRVKDSLIVEFWTQNAEWVQVAAVPGSRFIPLDSFPRFEYLAIGLDDPDYFHNGFQFRIRNLNERLGAFGIWHVDYIRLAQGDPTNQGFRDIAFSEPPSSALDKYTAMPLKHLRGFEDKEITKEVSAKFFNHFNTPSNPVETKSFFSENLSGKSWDFFTITNATNYPSQEIFATDRAIPNLNPFLAYLKDSTDNKDRLALHLNYTLSLGQDPLGLGNDTTATLTPIDNYFAYDDGTAERALEINGNGTQVALEFEANVTDFLGYVKVHLPYTGTDLTRQQFHLRIWANGAGLNDAPIYEKFNIVPTRSDFLQSFSTLEITDELGNFSPLQIESGKFYIGLENATNETPAFSIGYDKNNPRAADYLWFNSGADWKKYTDLIRFEGALMMRPVMTDVEVASSDPFTEKTTRVTLFPNPVREVLNFKIESDDPHKFRIFNTLGQLIHQDVLVSRLNVNGYLPGMYFIKITNLKSGDVQNLQFFKEQ